MKPYYLEVKEGETMLYRLESAIPFQAFSVGNTFAFDGQYIGVIEKVHHHLRDSSRDNETMHVITLTITPEE